MNAPATTAALLPATLSAPTLAEGELNAGLVCEAGAWHWLILLPAAEPARAGWKKQMQWAQEQGGDLPSRHEQSVLYANLHDQFEKDWYWSNTQYAGAAGYAWYQSFDYGDQLSSFKGRELRARAVRRLPI